MKDPGTAESVDERREQLAKAVAAIEEATDICRWMNLPADQAIRLFENTGENQWVAGLGAELPQEPSRRRSKEPASLMRSLGPR